MKRLKSFREKAKGFSDLLNYAAMVDDGIILNKDGSYSAAFRYRGQDFASSTDSERNTLADKMNQALLQLGTGYMIQCEACRSVVSSYSPAEESHFPHPVFREIDDSRRYYFETSGSKFVSKYFMVLTYMPPSKTMSKLTDLVFDNGDIEKESIAAQNLKRFKDKIREFMGILDIFLNIEQLKASKNDRVWQCEFLSFINYTVTGKWQPITLPHAPMYLDSYVGNYDFWTGLKPKLDDHYMSIISIDSFPDWGEPNLLADLDYLNIEYRWSTRYCIFDSTEAIKLLEKEQRKWRQQVVSFRDKLINNPNPKRNLDAAEMVTHYDSAINMARSGKIKYGHYTGTVIIRNKDLTLLESNAERIINCIRKKYGFTCRIESVNSVEAFLGSLPSDSLHNVRKPLISTLNLSHLTPLNAIWAGNEYCPCDKYPKHSPALMYCNAEGATAFRFNLHVKDVGHTLIFGPTGSGKSTLLAFIASQFMRYTSATLYSFDKGKSMYAVSQCGGKHYDIGTQGQVCFAPLKELDSDFNWCVDYIINLLKLQNMFVSSDAKIEIENALKLVKDSRVLTMTNFMHLVQNPEIKSAISYYTTGRKCGDLLDATDDSVSFTNLNVFEIETLMKRGDEDLLAVLLYLFHKIEKGLTGQPTMIIIDEAWVALKKDLFKEMIEEWLLVLRKANCLVILATQQLSAAVNSGIFDTLVESCKTQIFLPNDKAHQFADAYQKMGLNSKQIDIIKNAIMQRQYYIVSDSADTGEGNGNSKQNKRAKTGCRLVDLALNPLTLAFVGISSKPDIAKIQELVNEYGEAWYIPWLKYKEVFNEN